MQAPYTANFTTSMLCGSDLN